MAVGDIEIVDVNGDKEGDCELEEADGEIEGSAFWLVDVDLHLMIGKIFKKNIGWKDMRKMRAVCGWE